MMRTWDIGHGHPRDRCIEVEKRLVGHDGSDLRAEAARTQILMYDHAAARTLIPSYNEARTRAGEAVKHHISIPWHQGAEVDDVGTDPFRRYFTARYHCAPCDDRDPLALASLLRLAERQDELVARPWPARPAVVEHCPMLEKDHRVIAAKRRAGQT